MEIVKRENPFLWMIKKPLFWVEIIIMCIIPFPMETPGSFFGHKVVYIPCVNWMDNGLLNHAQGAYIYNTPYLTNDFFLAAMFLRFLFVLQTLVFLSPPNNQLIGKRICHEQGIEPSFSFQLKMAFKERPITLFSISALFNIMAFASLIRIFERPYWSFNFD